MSAFLGRDRIWHWFAALLLAVSLPVYARTATPSGVGFVPITIPDPVNGGTMPGYVFYPAITPSRATWIGPYELHATRDAPPVPGAKPLVVISHGNGGSDLGHHDLAVYLARHGVVAATLQHPYDNYLDDRGNGHPNVMIGRPIQVKATISLLLDSRRWGALIDPDRIGVAGFSLGGYTALMVVGATPDFARLIGFCKSHPGTNPGVPTSDRVCAETDRLKTYWARRDRTLAQAMAAMQADLHRWGSADDPRVKAAFVMAPFSVVFDKAGLASVNRPVFLYYG